MAYEQTIESLQREIFNYTKDGQVMDCFCIQAILYGLDRDRTLRFLTTKKDVSDLLVLRQALLAGLYVHNSVVKLRPCKHLSKMQFFRLEYITFPLNIRVTMEVEIFYQENFQILISEITLK